MQRRSLLKNIGLLAGGISLPDLADTPVKKAPSRVLRIAHITDIHVQPQLWAANGMAKCLHHIQNLSVKPDLIINGGDSIMGAGGSTQSKLATQWKLFHQVMKDENSLPLYSVIGNHDIWSNREQGAHFEDGKKWAMDEFGLQKPYYSLDKNGWHLVFLDSIHVRKEGFTYFAKLDEEQMDWLKKDLKQTSSQTPVMVISHIPILCASVFVRDKNIKNDSWLISGSWMHTDVSDIIDIFNKHGNVRLAVSGHTHVLDRVDYNHVSYCCNGAVCGNYWFGKVQETRAGYAVIDLFDDGSFTNQYVNYRVKNRDI